MTESPDFTKYSLKDLEYAEVTINRDKYPERYQKIIEELKKRGLDLPSGTEIRAPPSEILWRAASALIDIGLVACIASLFNNLVLFPVPWFFVEAIGLFVSVSYFLVAYLMTQSHQTIGQMISGLHIVSAKGGITKSNIAVRAFLIGLISCFPQPEQWIWVSALLVASVVALGLVNAWIMLFTEDKVLVHDFLSKTRVQFLDDPRRILTPLFNKRIYSFIALFVVGFISFFGLSSLTKSQQIESLASPIESHIENKLWHDLGKRSSARVSSEVVYKSNSPTIRRIIVQVWIPFFQWDNSEIDKIAQTVVYDLRVDPTRFDKGTLVLYTEFMLFSLRRPYELNLNK